MDEEQTQYQTAEGRAVSKRLSTDSTTPPTEVPGYRLQRFLGAGAFGQVWIGRDLNTGRSVAVKFYLHRGGVNWALLSHEVKHLVQLSADRHVVQVLEVGWDASPPYYVMELISGGSLEELLKTRGELPVWEAVDLFRKICVGLNHCHGKGVLHCDLKPANILLGNDHEPRLADFGQSRMSHDQTPTLGTLFYMAPEQADLEASPDAKWDVYAVGAILYRMLTGHPPYRDDTVVNQIDTAGSLPKRLKRYREAITECPLAMDELGRRGVDRPLQRIVARCLATDSDQRYDNVQQILQSLSRRDQVRARRPLMLLGIVGPLLLLTATSIFGVRTIRRASDSMERELRTEAFGSNMLAAKFAARTLETELDRYFELTRRTASSPQFVQVLSDAITDDDVKQTLESISSATTAAEAQDMSEARERLLDLRARLNLDKQLKDRLAKYTGDTLGIREPRLATMFVTDAKGTVIGIAYEGHVERAQNSAGRNYSYRTYFHGGPQDLDQGTPINSINPLRNTHLSAAFQSTATGLWKVAVSTPVYLSADQNEPDAVFVVTINLGDFPLPQSEKGASQITALIDARDGESRGTVLQHPLLDARSENGGHSAGERSQIKSELMNRMLEGGDVDYRDPMAAADDGQDYDGDWLAAIQPVALPVDSNDTTQEATDLLVLVQYRLKTLFAPVGKMQNSLLWEGAAAIISILIVALSFWVLVNRAGTSKSSVSKPDPIVPTGDTETIAV